MTPDDLRALCPTCRKAVRVRLRGAAWRMEPHKRSVREFYRDREIACPIRGVDALPAVADWLARRATDLDRDEARAAERRDRAALEVAAADNAIAAARTGRETLAALRALVPADGARP